MESHEHGTSCAPDRRTIEILEDFNGSGGLPHSKMLNSQEMVNFRGFPDFREMM